MEKDTSADLSQTTKMLLAKVYAAIFCPMLVFSYSRSLYVYQTKVNRARDIVHLTKILYLLKIVVVYFRYR